MLHPTLSYHKLPCYAGRALLFSFHWTENRLLCVCWLCIEWGRARWDWELRIGVQPSISQLLIQYRVTPQRVHTLKWPLRIRWSQSSFKSLYRLVPRKDNLLNTFPRPFFMLMPPFLVCSYNTVRRLKWIKRNFESLCKAQYRDKRRSDCSSDDVSTWSPMLSEQLTRCETIIYICFFTCDVKDAIVWNVFYLGCVSAPRCILVKSCTCSMILDIKYWSGYKF